MTTIKKHVANIQKNGYTIIRNGTNLDLANNVIKDFDEWGSLPENNFVPFQQERVTNFHIHNQNTLDLVTNTTVNKILTTLFKKEPSIYSSLFFREGTTEPYHINTPYFYTNPLYQSYSVWYALEDIDENAGPLKYYVGSHMLDDSNGHEIYNSIYTQDDNVDLNNDFRCIVEYNKKIEDKCKELNLIENSNKLYKGDILILHPKILYGGSDIIDNSLTNYCMVTINIPIDTAVFNAKHFFSPSPTEEYLKNECTFEYISHNGIHIVEHNVAPQVQKTYT